MLLNLQKLIQILFRKPWAIDLSALIKVIDNKLSLELR